MPLLARDLMWAAPPMIPADTTLKNAAEKMIELNAGVLPVGIDGKVEGIITDRDIVIRAVSKGKDPGLEKVSNCMTQELYICKEDDTLRTAADLMKKKGVSRLVVLNNQNKLSGILSFGHIFRNDADAEEATEIVTRVANRHSNPEKEL